jgi:hypothetical protein
MAHPRCNYREIGIEHVLFFAVAIAFLAFAVKKK